MLKHTLYRVVIRDKEYWNGVQKHGGLPKFNPAKFFHENRLKLKPHDESSLESSRSPNRSTSPSKRIPILDDKGRINK